MKISFSRYCTHEQDMPLPLPVLLELDFKTTCELVSTVSSDFEAQLQHPFPRTYEVFLSTIKKHGIDDSDSGEAYLLKLLAFLKGIHAPLIRAQYIPRHYMYMNTLFHCFRELDYASQKVYRTLKDGREVFDIKLYLRMTELLNAIQKNKRTKTRSGTLLQGISQLWKGKPGLPRQSILGFRTCYTGRGVLIPDPSLKLDEVKLPHLFRQELTLTEVWKHGSGVQTHEILSIFIPSIQRWISYRMWERQSIAKKLSLEGMLVNRRLCVGDIVLVNRQPSLRLQNILSLRVARFGDPSDQTIALNLALLEGYGGDCDGDELNIYVPQSDNVRTEVAEKMSVDRNKIDLGTGKLIWGHSQDVCIGSYLNPELDTYSKGIDDMHDMTKEVYWDVQDKAYSYLGAQGFSLSLADLRPGLVDHGNWDIMVDSGAKGKAVNILQMAESLGLQLVNGQPAGDVYHRTSKGDGILTSSYYRGLTCGEFAQHLMAAREGMISSAKSTADSGYRTRCMNQSLADVDCDDAFDRRMGLVASISLGQTMTQAQLSGFHAIGQQKLRSGLDDILSLLCATKGGNKSKKIIDNEGNILYSFTDLECHQKGGALHLSQHVRTAYDVAEGIHMAAVNQRVNNHLVDDFLTWFTKQNVSKILKILYSSLKDRDSGIICSDIHMVQDLNGVEEAKSQLYTLYSMSFMSEIESRHRQTLVDMQFAGGRFSSVTRHGDTYSQKGPLARAAWECAFTELRKAAEKGEVDPMQNLVAKTFFLPSKSVSV